MMIKAPERALISKDQSAGFAYLDVTGWEHQQYGGGTNCLSGFLVCKALTAFEQLEFTLQWKQTGRACARLQSSIIICLDLTAVLVWYKEKKTTQKKNKLMIYLLWLMISDFHLHNIAPFCNHDIKKGLMIFLAGNSIATATRRGRK